MSSTTLCITETLLQSLNAFYASKKCYFHKNKFSFSLYFLMLLISSLNKILIIISNIFQYLWWSYWFQLTTYIETITLLFLHPETQDHSVSSPSVKRYQIQAQAGTHHTFSTYQRQELLNCLDKKDTSWKWIQPLSSSSRHSLPVMESAVLPPCQMNQFHIFTPLDFNTVSILCYHLHQCPSRLVLTSGGWGI